MPAKRSAMRKIKDVLRLKFEAKLSHERIAAATGISKGAVSNYVQRALQKGLGWPLPAELDEGQLEELEGSGQMRNMVDGMMTQLLSKVGPYELFFPLSNLNVA